MRKVMGLMSVSMLTAVIACSSEDEPSGPASDKGTTESDSGGPVQTGGRCSGTARECRRYRDVESCHKQKNCLWNGNDTFPCGDGRVLPCSYYDGDKPGCLQHIGCIWTDEDGTEETSLRKGNCIGTAVPCEDMEKEQCQSRNPGCKWNIYDEVCERDRSKRGGACSDFTLRDPLDTYFHVDILERRCELRDDCSWEDTTGKANPDGGPGPTPP